MAQIDNADRVQSIRTSISDLISNETELAKAELVPAAKNAGIGSGLFAGAGAFLGHAIWMLIIAIALAIAWLLDSVTDLGPWGSGTIAFLITVVLSLLIAGVLALLGRSRMKKVTKPEATIAEAKATLSAVTDALTGHPTGTTIPAARPMEDLSRR